jgi:PKD repeat protein
MANARHARGLVAKLCLPVAFLSMHAAWGIGFWQGLLRSPRGQPSGGRLAGAPRPSRARAGRRSHGLLVALAVAVLTAGLTSPTGAADEQTTSAGPDYTGAYLEPSGSKPQSKLWFHDGSWWGVLFQKATLKFQIFRLDGSSGWVDTGVVVDSRVNSRSDALWDGTRLYVATHRYSLTSEAGFPARLLRYSYDPGARRFVPDTGFPVQINNYKTETLVIDKDTTGTLWATWTQGGRVYVNRTVGDDRTWGIPAPLPVTGATVSADDISTVVAFDGKVGVMWGNQLEGAYYFTAHVDGDPAEVWQATEAALVGPGMADDHVDLATDGSGRVWAVVKTGLHGAADPLIVLLARRPDGTWDRHTVASNRYSHTRPIVLVDDEQRTVHVLATGPQSPATNGQAGGDIYEKTTSMDAPAFTDGYGTPVIHIEGQPSLDNVTSTKQRLTAASGLVALATSEPLKQYWYLYRPAVPGGTVTVPPKASFTAEPLNGTASHTVRFADTSTGSPTTWSWSFGDGETADEPNPEHLYQSPGTYTVSLTVSNADGTDTTTLTGLVTVTGPVNNLGAAADAHVRKAKPMANYGGLTTMRATDSGSDAYQAYVAFDVPAGRPVRAAVLRLWVTGGSPYGGSVSTAPSGWGESTLTWANAPGPGGTALGVLGRVSTGTWVEVDVSTAVVAGQRASFVVVSASADSAYYSSREGVHAPELVVTTD